MKYMYMYNTVYMYMEKQKQKRLQERHIIDVMTQYQVSSIWCLKQLDG